MACKIKDLETELRNAGFIPRQGGRGSHTVWKHVDYPKHITIAGQRGNDAPRYLERNVKVALNSLKEINEFRVSGQTADEQRK
ncbi:MAG: type II toxin-antitoxin system HicA family toxin [Coleofasciculaceae cyanobacterium]